MPDISTIHVNNTDYNIKDATARSSIPSAYTSNPAMDGTASPGSSTDYAKGDHVHPTDTSRAPLASPTFTGTPAAPTASAGTNTTQIATTAFVKTAVDNAVTNVLTFKGTKTSAAAIKALTSAAVGDLWIVSGATGTAASENGQEWVCTTAVSGTASASSWELLGSVGTDNLGAFAYVDTGTVQVTQHTYGTNVTLGGSNAGKGVTDAGSLPSHGADSFSAGTLPSFARGTFTQGTQATFIEGAFTPNTLPSWSATVENEVLSFSFSAGTQASKAADLFTPNTLPTHAADTFNAGTLPSYTQGTFDAGSLPTLSTKNVPSSGTISHSTAVVDLTVYPASE